MLLFARLMSQVSRSEIKHIQTKILFHLTLYNLIISRSDQLGILISFFL